MKKQIKMKTTQLLITLLLCVLSLSASAQQTYDLMIDKSKQYGAIPKDAVVANFHLWVPNGETPKYVLFLIPTGSGEDTAKEFKNPKWMRFAEKNHLAVLTCGFTFKEDAPLHDKVDQWSGKMIVDALKKLSILAEKPEVADLPFFLWGSHDVGCGTAKNFAVWNPARVAAFVANGVVFEKSKASEKIPALFTENTAVSRKLFDVYNDARRHNAPWCWAIGKKDSGVNYVQLSIAFFESIIADSKTPWIGDLQDKTIAAADGDKSSKTKDTVWLPDETFAHVWQQFVGGKE